MALRSFLNNLPQTIYCERGLSPELFSEPINAITNFTFPILGYLSLKELKKTNINNKEILLLPYLLSLVGIGSFLYHTARNSYTLILDAVPIYIFILFTLFIVLKKLTKNKIKALSILISFILLEVFLTQYVPREFMNGSIRHITAIGFISLVGVFIYKKFGEKVIKPFVSVLAFYAIAILSRSIDTSVCSMVPVGTHFLWHTFAAIAGYYAIKLVSLLEKQQ